MRDVIYLLHCEHQFFDGFQHPVPLATCLPIFHLLYISVDELVIHMDVGLAIITPSQKKGLTYEWVVGNGVRGVWLNSWFDFHIN